MRIMVYLCKKLKNNLLQNKNVRGGRPGEAGIKARRMPIINDLAVEVFMA